MQISLEESAPADLPGLSVWDDAQEWSRFSQSLPAEGAAFKEADGLWESQLLVIGMHCAACSLMLERALLASPGVVSVKVSAASQRASVVWSASQTRP